MTDTSETADMIAAMLRNDPMESTENADPIEPIDPIEPTLPTESTEPELPIESNELRERMLNTDELAGSRVFTESLYLRAAETDAP
jgi:hypothetical protein